MFSFISRDHIVGFAVGVAVLLFATLASGCSPECEDVPVDTDVVETDTDTDPDTDTDTDTDTASDTDV